MDLPPEFGGSVSGGRGRGAMTASADSFIKVPLTREEQRDLLVLIQGAPVGPWIRQQVLEVLGDFVRQQEVAEQVARTSLPTDTVTDWCFRANPQIAAQVDVARGYAPRGRWVRAVVLRLLHP